MRNFQFSIFNFQKFKTKLNQKGISLVEVVVSMAVMVILTGFIIADQQVVRGNQLLTGQADLLANELTRAQAYTYAPRNVAASEIDKYEVYFYSDRFEMREFTKTGGDTVVQAAKLLAPIEISVADFQNFTTDNPKLLRFDVNGRLSYGVVLDVGGADFACLAVKNTRTNQKVYVRVLNGVKGTTAANQRFDRVNLCSAEAVPFVPPGVPGAGGGTPTPPTPTPGQFNVNLPTVGPCVQVFRPSPTAKSTVRNGIRLFGIPALALTATPAGDFGIDSDSDGVCDSTDPCPLVPGSNNGCPPSPTTGTDSDGDGVVDGDDLCSTDAGSPAFGGCPNPSPQVTPVPTGLIPTAGP